MGVCYTSLDMSGYGFVGLRGGVLFARSIESYLTRISCVLVCSRRSRLLVFFVGGLGEVLWFLLRSVARLIKRQRVCLNATLYQMSMGRSSGVEHRWLLFGADASLAF